MRVVSAPDLILLELYAGGPQDLWDVHQLLDADASSIADVEARLPALPEDCTDLWQRVRGERAR